MHDDDMTNFIAANHGESSLFHFGENVTRVPLARRVFNESDARLTAAVCRRTRKARTSRVAALQ